MTLFLIKFEVKNESKNTVFNGKIEFFTKIDINWPKNDQKSTKNRWSKTGHNLTIKSWVVGSRRMLGEKCVMTEAPNLTTKSDQKWCHTQKLLKNHQNHKIIKMQKIRKSEKVSKTWKWKITKMLKMQKLKIIKKVSKFIKNVKNPFLGRKRKRRGSMRFGKNAPTRWLGKHVKWHLPL